MAEVEYEEVSPLDETDQIEDISPLEETDDVKDTKSKLPVCNGPAANRLPTEVAEQYVHRESRYISIKAC